jgi:PPK2 family polyphosphate:nucleotide phosphotransferase
VPPGRRLRLPDDRDPRWTGPYADRDAASIALDERLAELSAYQERLAAQDTWSLLIIFQALDAAGKDGTIRHVLGGLNPQGVEVTAFKAPTSTELDHDFLWRCALRLPARGMIGVFNRSYYEECLVVRVHPEILGGQKLPPAVAGRGIWARRFRAINEWERHLVENGTRIVKLFLNVSREEQRERFLARIAEPEKHWKFQARDVRERQHWDEYQKAYADVLSETSTDWAPWYVVPADRKWFMRLAAATIIVDALRSIDPRYPEVDEAARAEMLAARDELLSETGSGQAAEAVQAPRPRSRRRPSSPAPRKRASPSPSKRRERA